MGAKGRVRILLATLGLVGSYAGGAAIDATDPLAWAATLGPLPVATCPQTVLALELESGVGKHPRLVTLDRAAMERDGSVRPLVPGAWKLGESINSHLKTWNTPGRLLAISGADLLIFRVDEGAWSVAVPGVKGAVALADKGTKASALPEKLHNYLAYDGVVLAVRNDQILLRTADLSAFAPGSIQSVALKDSADELSLGGRAIEGNGVLELVRGGKDFSVFTMVLGDSKALTPGIKIRLQARPK